MGTDTVSEETERFLNKFAHLTAGAEFSGADPEAMATYMVAGAHRLYETRFADEYDSFSAFTNAVEFGSIQSQLRRQTQYADRPER